MTRRSVVAVISSLLGLRAELSDRQGTDQDNTCHYVVSLIQVIANPNAFNGQRVRILGYLGYSYPDTGLGIYVSEIDGRNGIVTNSVDLRVDKTNERKIEALIKNYVIFSPVYHAPPPQAGFNGTFDQILDPEPWGAKEPRTK